MIQNKHALQLMRVTRIPQRNQYLDQWFPKYWSWSTI